MRLATVRTGFWEIQFKNKDINAIEDNQTYTRLLYITSFGIKDGSENSHYRNHL
jgi:hypothetical protein